MISRSERVAASRSGRPARREYGRGVLVGALSPTLRSLLLELCLLGREGGDLRRPSFSGSAPAVGRSGRHGHLVLGSHSFSPSVIPTLSSACFWIASHCSGRRRRNRIVGSLVALELRRPVPRFVSRIAAGAVVGFQLPLPLCGPRRRGCRARAVVARQRAEESGCVNRSRSPAVREDKHRDCCRVGSTGAAACGLLLCCGGHGRRLSAPLAENVAPEARRAGLSERSPDFTIIRPSRSDLAPIRPGAPLVSWDFDVEID